MKIFLYIGKDKSIELKLKGNTTSEYINPEDEDLNNLKEKTVDLIISENDEINYYISKKSIYLLILVIILIYNIYMIQINLLFQI